MSKISEIQAETGVLEGAASLATIADFTPSGGANNGVVADGGLDYLKFNSFSIPNNTTKILFYVKKKVANATNSEFSLSYLGSASPQYGVVSQIITLEGLNPIEVTTFPTAGNNILVLDGPNMAYDRIEFHDNTVVAAGSDIITSSGTTLSKNTGVAKFQNTGDAVAVGSTITFLPTFNPAYLGTLTPTCSKGSFAQSGSNWVLTVSSEIASNELFDVNFTLSVFIKKSTVLTFDVVSVTGFTENNLTNDTTSATFTPSANLSVSEVSKSANGFAVNIVNNGTDAIDSGQTILIKANGTNVPTGSNLTATSPKGSFVGTDWVNGVVLTLSSELSVNETFAVTFAFATPVSTSYASTTSAVWQSSVTDPSNTDNSIVVSFSTSTPTAPVAPTLSTVKATYSGDSQSGTAAESGTILMLLNGNIVGQTTTSGPTNAWSIVCANAGSYAFQLANTNGTSLPTSAIAVVNRPSNDTPTNGGIINNTPKKETFASKYLTAKNLMITGGLIVAIAILFWAFKSEEE